MNETTDSASPATSLLTSLAASLGMEVEPSQCLLAVEFASGDHVASIFPHPGRADFLCVEIELRALALGQSGSDSGKLLFLHRMNAAARHDHAWTISIDEKDMLLLGAAFPLSGLDVESLGGYLEEGFQRAESLDRIWQALRDDAEESPDIAAEFAYLPPSQLA